jgi:hypothetical protein
MTTLNVLSSDGVNMELNIKKFKIHSLFIKEMLDENTDEEDVINIPYDERQIQDVIDYIDIVGEKIPKAVKKPLTSSVLHVHTGIHRYDYILKILHRDPQSMAKLLKIADYFSIDSLLDTWRTTIACLQMLTPPDMINQRFNLGDKPSEKQLEEFDRLLRPHVGPLI